MGPSRGTILGALAGALAAVSTAAVVVLLAAPLSALTIAAGRVGVTGIGLLAIGGRSNRHALSALATRRVALRTALAAALLAVHFAAWIASLGMTSVVRSVTLVATQPLFAGLFARALGDRTPWQLYAGSAVAVAGTVVMLGAGDALAGGPTLGDALALLAAIAAAAYLCIGRSVRMDVPLTTYLAVVHLGAAAILGVALLFTSHPPFASAAAQDWLAVLYLGLVPGIIGHGLLNWAVRHLPVHTVSLAILCEPVGATALAAIVLGAVVGMHELAGGAVILAGVGLGIPRASR